MSELSPHNIQKRHDRINQKAIVSWFLIGVVCLVASYIIGTLEVSQSKVLVYSYRLFSRGYLQASNSIYDTKSKLNKFAATHELEDLEEAYTRLLSGRSILLSLKSEAQVGEFDKRVSLIHLTKVVIRFDDLIKILEKELIKKENGIDIDRREIELIKETLDELVEVILAEESSYWKKRAQDFHEAQVREEKDLHILYGIFTLFILAAGFLCYFILKRRKLEKEVEETRTRLFHGQRLSALGEFSSSVAHEINNPLHIILWRLSVMRRELSQSVVNPRIIDSMDKIKDQCLRIDKIIKGIKLLSKNSNNLENERFSLKDTFSDLKDVVEHKIEQGRISFEINDNFADTTLYGKQVQLVQVFTNLINNSIDAISSLDERWIRLEINIIGTSVKISVKDSGHGIPKDQQKQIFNSFYSSKKMNGTGIGLGISSQIIASMGGKLSYNNQSIHTEFIISLPISDKYQFVSKDAERLSGKGETDSSYLN